MNLKTQYLGLELTSPLVVSASPLSQSIENIKNMEKRGAGAVVLHSLFEEQIRAEAAELEERLTQHNDSFAEALSYFPSLDAYRLTSQQYLQHIKAAKAAVEIPIIASLNGSSSGGWTAYAKQIEDAGADAIELNIYNVPTDDNLTGLEVEDEYVEITRAVREAVTIPVAVKLSPFFTNLPHLSRRLVEAGADGLVLFNRFYEPDVDVESGEVRVRLSSSTSDALPLPLRWVGILAGSGADLAATGGVHTTQDVIKVIKAGASVAMVCSSLYRNGIDHLEQLRDGVAEWLTVRHFNTIDEIRGTSSQREVKDPSAFVRAQFVKTLLSPEPNS